MTNLTIVLLAFQRYFKTYMLRK